jgi:hypothetical protein
MTSGSVARCNLCLCTDVGVDVVDVVTLQFAVLDVALVILDVVVVLVADVDDLVHIS